MRQGVLQAKEPVQERQSVVRGELHQEVSIAGVGGRNRSRVRPSRTLPTAARRSGGRCLRSPRGAVRSTRAWPGPAKGRSGFTTSRLQVARRNGAGVIAAAVHAVRQVAPDRAFAEHPARFATAAWINRPAPKAVTKCQPQSQRAGHLNALMRAASLAGPRRLTTTGLCPSVAASASPATGVRASGPLSVGND